MRLAAIATALCLLTLGLGCSGPLTTRGGADPWPQRGVVRAINARQQRCQVALTRLQHTSPAPPTLRVLDNDAPTAYAYRGGRIYVTRALVDIATDDELTAALAHELGHLSEPRKLQASRALSDARPPADAESRADTAALALLRDAGIPAAAMATLLEKVREHPATPADVRPPLAARITLLRAGAR